jgi:uncharacterized membrane protein YjfL (UPF0719 family)
MVDTLLSNLLSATVFAVLGIAVFAVAFVLFDKLTPGHLWEELTHRNNTGAAIVVGSVAIGLSIIIAAAIH